MTYQLAEIHALGHIVQQVLLEKPKHLPGFEHLDEALLVVSVLGAVRSLEDEADDVVYVGGEVADVSPLHVFHDAVHHVQIHELSLLVLPKQIHATLVGLLDSGRPTVSFLKPHHASVLTKLQLSAAQTLAHVSANLLWQKEC